MRDDGLKTILVLGAAGYLLYGWATDDGASDEELATSSAEAGAQCMEQLETLDVCDGRLAVWNPLPPLHPTATDARPAPPSCTPAAAAHRAFVTCLMNATGASLQTEEDFGYWPTTTQRRMREVWGEHLGSLLELRGEDNRQILLSDLGGLADELDDDRQLVPTAVLYGALRAGGTSGQRQQAGAVLDVLTGDPDAAWSDRAGRWIVDQVTVRDGWDVVGMIAAKGAGGAVRRTTLRIGGRVARPAVARALSVASETAAESIIENAVDRATHPREPFTPLPPAASRFSTASLPLSSFRLRTSLAPSEVVPSQRYGWPAPFPSSYGSVDLEQPLGASGALVHTASGRHPDIDALIVYFKKLASSPAPSLFTEGTPLQHRSIPVRTTPE